MSTAVVYFSRTGATRAAAEYIAEKLDAELFELRRKEPYPEEYRAVVNVALEELKSHALPELEVMPDVAGYDTVLVGSPNWCGTFVAPVSTFLAKAGLAGKRVALFCTSGGSGLRNMPGDAAALCPDAKFLTPVALAGGDDTAAMDAWIEEIKA